MRAVWQIAISSLKAKSGRTLLLMLAVAIATALAVAITGGVTMAKQMAKQRIRQIVGQTGLRVINTQGGGITREVHEKIKSFSGIAYAPAQRRQLFTLLRDKPTRAKSSSKSEMVLDELQLTVTGIDPAVDRAIASRQTGRKTIDTVDGRSLMLGAPLPAQEKDGEPAALIIGSQVQRLLSLKLGDHVHIAHPKKPDERFAFKVSGVIYRTGSMLFQRPIAYVSMSTHDKLVAWFHESKESKESKAIDETENELAALFASKLKSVKPVSSDKPAPALMPALAPSAAALDAPLNFSWIDVVPESADPAMVDQMVADLQAELSDQYQIRSMAAQSSQVAQWDSQLSLMVLCISGVVFMSAGFIVLTSMLSSLAQQRRQLAVLRCIGCSRWLIAKVQLLTGGLLGVGGGILGMPMGMLMLYAMHSYRRNSELSTIREQLTPISESGQLLPIPESGQAVLTFFERSMPFEMDVDGIIKATLMAAAATLLASLIPAYFAIRTSPLKAMVSNPRFKPAHLLVIGILALASLSLSLYLAVGTLPENIRASLAAFSDDAQTDVDVQFWLYVYLGLPLTFIGFFLLAIPLAYLVSFVTGGVLARLFKVPASLFSQTVRSMPYRLGLTAGALMVGLSILLGIWTDGRSIMDGWFDKIKMPDAVLAGLPFIGISDENLAELKQMPEIQTVSSSSAYSVRADSINKDPRRRFGVSGLGGKSTLFVAADVAAFVSMTELEWIDGDKDSALKRLSEGAAILVSREYKVAHDIKLGDYLYLKTPRGKVPFEIAGVISSPGLDIAVHHFDIGASFEDASVASVFGTREDGELFFGAQKANMALLSFKPEVSQAEQEALLTVIATKMSVLAQSSRQIKQNVIDWANRMMGYMSLLAAVSLLIACLGVGNLVVTNIQSRQFEFGVLRATGSSGFLISRLILAESLVVAITGCLCGTLLGYQLSTASAALRNRAFGLGYTPAIPWDIASYGYLAILLAATMTCLPAALKLMRKSPRELVS